MSRDGVPNFLFAGYPEVIRIKVRDISVFRPNMMSAFPAMTDRSGGILQPKTGFVSTCVNSNRGSQMRIMSFEVEGLFGIFDHTVKLNQEERVTIIYGPNGFGKTTLLRLVRGFFSKDFEVFGSTPFRRFSMRFDDGRVIMIQKSYAPNESEDTPRCEISELVGGEVAHSHLIFPSGLQASIGKQLETVAPFHAGDQR